MAATDERASEETVFGGKKIVYSFFCVYMEEFADAFQMRDGRRLLARLSPLLVCPTVERE